jgi:hypothetical protein
LKTLYEILEISTDASEIEIKSAFRKLAKEFHPDKNENNDYFNTRFSEINKAYKILINQSLKIRYDQSLNEKTNVFHQSYTSGNSFDESQLYTTAEIPKFNHIYESNKNNLVFFKFPKQIGKILTGESDLIEGTRILNKPELVVHIFKENWLTILGILIFAIVSYNINNRIVYSSILFLSISTIYIVFKYLQSFQLLHFIFMNEYVCEQGFAMYVCEKKIENTILDKEISFISISDYFFIEISDFAGLIYKKTFYQIICLDKHQKIIFDYSDEYKSLNRNPPHEQNELYWFNKLAYNQYSNYMFSFYSDLMVKNKTVNFPIYFHGIILDYLRLNSIGLEYEQDDIILIINYSDINKIQIKRNRMIIKYFDRISLQPKSIHTVSIDTVYLSNKEILYKLFSSIRILNDKIAYP